MDRDANEQGEIVINRIIENEAVDVPLNTAGAIRNEQTLLNAADLGDCETVIEMLREGASIEAENVAQILHDSMFFMTPLQIAASKGYVEVIQILIDHGANIHAKNRFGYTALHLAASNGQYHCLKTLLKAGADGSASIGMLCKAEAFGLPGASSLHLAAYNNHIDCVEELLQYGVDCEALDENGHSSRYIVAKKAINECVFTFLKTAGHQVDIDAPYTTLSFKFRILECVKKLLFIGSIDNDIKSNGISPLPVFLSTGFEDVDAEIFKLFVLESYCIDRNIPRGLTTLRHFGFEYYDSKVAAILITCTIVIKEKNLIMSLIEFLLKVSGRFDTLKYVVKCTPWLPHLKSLTTLSIADELSVKNFDDINLQNLVLPHNVTFVLERGVKCLYVEIHDRGVELIQLELMWDEMIKGVPKYGRYRLQQPLLNLIYERISDEIDQLNLIIGDKYILKNRYYSPQTCYRLELWNIKKCLWYEMKVSYPPTLQQCCRYFLLKCMGPLNVKHIRKLPLPNKLKSYLLFKCDE